MPLLPSDYAKYISARAALSEVRDGMILGLGTGSTAEWFVRVLAEWCRVHGAQVTGIPTSERTGALAQSLGIALTTLQEAGRFDLTVDGADEFDPQLDLIKGGGGAHLREKIVAAACNRMVVISDASKEVAQLGAFPLPVEVIPFGHGVTCDHIRDLIRGYEHQGEDVISLRGGANSPYQTDEGNFIYDLRLGAVSNAATLATELSALPGVVEHGFFIDIAKAVYLGHPDGRAERIEPGGRQDVSFEDGLDEVAFLERC